MTTILVVDDSLADRQLVGGLLQKAADWHIAYAHDGVEAMEAMGRGLPDLVVTDLVMPNMDGLKLVAAVRSKHPQVPIILMTSQGNEEIAVQALQEGAASYVPKQSLARKLLDTVHRVLAVASRQRSYLRLWECVVTSEFTLILENECGLIGPLVSFLQEQIMRMGLCDETDRMRIGIALEEALANALYHGNLEVRSDLREDDDKAYYAMVEERCRQRPYSDRRIYVSARLTRDGATFIVRDEGSGFDPSNLPDPTDPANLERVSGRGILLMQTFMDEVAYNDLGNEVTLRKRRAASPQRAHCERV
jgi:CheY-like chemotaxis protein/anti-sigma regulatory factor (Ser/Thr protein kinase)